MEAVGIWKFFCDHRKGYVRTLIKFRQFIGEKKLKSHGVFGITAKACAPSFLEESIYLDSRRLTTLRATIRMFEYFPRQLLGLKDSHQLT